MGVKRVSELTAGILIVIFLILAIFSHRQNLAASNEIQVYRKDGHIVSERKVEKLFRLKDLMYRKIQKWC